MINKTKFGPGSNHREDELVVRLAALSEQKIIDTN